MKKRYLFLVSIFSSLLLISSFFLTKPNLVADFHIIDPPLSAPCSMKQVADFHIIDPPLSSLSYTLS